MSEIEEIENSPPNSQDRGHGKVVSTSSNSKRGRLRLSTSRVVSSATSGTPSKTIKFTRVEMERKWVCDICSLENDFTYTSCELCEAERPKGGGLRHIERENTITDGACIKGLHSVDDEGDDDYSTAHSEVRHALPDAFDDRSEEDFEPGSFVSINCGDDKNKHLRRDEIEDSDDEKGWAGVQPQPSFPEISGSFFTVRDLKRYDLCVESISKAS